MKVRRSVPWPKGCAARCQAAESVSVERPCLRRKARPWPMDALLSPVCSNPFHTALARSCLLLPGGLKNEKGREPKLPPFRVQGRKSLPPAVVIILLPT